MCHLYKKFTLLPRLRRWHHRSESVRLSYTLIGHAYGVMAAVSADDKVCFALAVPLDREGSSRAEFRMNVNSEAT